MLRRRHQHVDVRLTAPDAYSAVTSDSIRRLVRVAHRTSWADPANSRGGWHVPVMAMIRSRMGLAATAWSHGRHSDREHHLALKPRPELPCLRPHTVR
jgi:hypothetical protein